MKNKIEFIIRESKKETKEAFTRYSYFVHANKHILEACKNKFEDDFRPDYVILLKTECLYKSLSKTLNRLPSFEKNALGQDIRDCILNIRTHILRSANIYSLATTEAKKASCELSALQGHIDLLYVMQYITAQFHLKLSDQLSDISYALDLWFEVLK